MATAAFAAVGGLLAAWAAPVPLAGAQDPGTASVVIVHGLRGFTADLYLDGQLLIDAFQPERATDPMPVPAGRHLVEIREAGQPAASPPAVTASFDLVAGLRYEAVAHLDAAGAPLVSLFVDDVSPVPPGQSRAVLRHAAAASPIDVQLDSAVVATGLAGGQEAANVLPAGTYGLVATPAGGGDAVAAPQQVDVAEGTASFLYLIGSAEDRTLDWLIVQASGLESMPTKVPTGDGSATQPPTESNGTGGEMVGLGAVAVFFAVATIRRLRRAA